MDQLSDNEKIALVLHFLAEQGWQKYKENLFQGMARILATTLDIDYVLVTTVKSPDTGLARTAAVFSLGESSSNIEYPLEGTPCAEVFNNKLCIYENGVTEKFSDDHLLSEFNAEAYIGAPLLDSEGNPTGLIALVHRQPFVNLDLCKTLIQIVATRVAVELEREWKDEAIKLSEEKYRLLFENAFDAVYLVDQTSHKILDANRAATAMLGYSREQLLGMRFLNLFKKEFVDIITENYRKDQLPTKVEKFEAVQVNREGQKVPVEIDSCKGEFGREETIQYYVRDLRTQKELEEQLLHSHKMEAVGTLAGGISHDFNNLLMGILGFAELAMRESRDSSVNTKLENIVDACQHARSLVLKILSFSSKTPKLVSVFSLHDVIKDTVKDFCASVPPSVDIEVLLGESKINIKGDATEIEQVIVNLCSNAAYALKNKSGKICIELSSRAIEKKDATILSLEPGQYACLKISDDGVGMNDEIRRRIFEPFFTTNKHGEGAGLGLSIAYGIVKSHQGAIAVDSQLGLGSTVTIFLPLCGPQEVALAESEAKESEEIRQEKVLVVDDDPKVLMILEEALKLFGFQPVACSSAAKALNIFTEAPSSFSTIITDQAMPGMSGDQLIKEVRVINDSVPIVLCTGYADLSADEWMSELHLFTCLKKPFTMSTLSEVLTQIGTKQH